MTEDAYHADHEWIDQPWDIVFTISAEPHHDVIFLSEDDREDRVAWLAFRGETIWDFLLS
jgi:hypothetical protein